MDKPSCSKTPDPDLIAKSKDVEMIDLIDLDEEIILNNENIPIINDENNERINLDETLQKQLEQWKSYGKRKLSKLELQHEDDIDFYSFASSLMLSDDDCLKEFKEFVENEKKTKIDGDTYEEIDMDVLCLLDQIYFGQSPQLKGLFNNICIWVNGWTYPVAKTIHQLVHLCGGEYCLTYNPHKVTHIISTVISMSNLKSDKHQQNTVNPEWIIDSLKEAKILPLFDYRVLRPKNDIKKMFQKQFKKNRMILNSKNNEDIEYVANFSRTPTKSDAKSKTNNLSNFIPKSFSDIDPEVLKSLPPEVVKELQAGMNSAIQTSSSSSSSAKPKLKQQTLTFMKSKINNKKSSPKKAKDSKTSSNMEQMKIDILIKKKKDTSEKILDLFSGKMDRKLGPNLCGLTKLDDYNSILEEWFIQTNSLSDQDVTYFLRFIASLIDNNKHDLLLQILCNLRQFIIQRQNNGGKEMETWKTFFFDTLKEFLQFEDQFASKIPDDLFVES